MKTSKINLVGFHYTQLLSQPSQIVAKNLPGIIHFNEETYPHPLKEVDISILLRETIFLIFLSDPHSPAQKKSTIRNVVARCQTFSGFTLPLPMGRSSRPPPPPKKKGFSSITFEQNKLETSNFALLKCQNYRVFDIFLDILHKMKENLGQEHVERGFLSFQGLLSLEK